MRKNEGDGDEDAAAPSIASDVLRSLIMVVTEAMTTAIANTTVPVPVTSKNITYYFATKPYDDKSFETKTKEGNYRWHLTTKTAKVWKKDGISSTFKHADKILDLLKDRLVQFWLDNIMNIPTSGTGAVHATPRTIVGVDHRNTYVRYYINTLSSYHQLSLDQVRAFYCVLWATKRPPSPSPPTWILTALTQTRPETSALWIDTRYASDSSVEPSTSSWKIMSPGQATTHFSPRRASSYTHMTAMGGISHVTRPSSWWRFKSWSPSWSSITDLERGKWRGSDHKTVQKQRPHLPHEDAGDAKRDWFPPKGKYQVRRATVFNTHLR